jgi:hypothetical protein
MATGQQAYVPTMSDAVVAGRTGKDWAHWFAALDRAGARRREHRANAQWLKQRHGLSGWWSQMVTVQYERARGLRVTHQTERGFAVAVSTTVATSVSKLYAETVSAARRKRWFPTGSFAPSSKKRNKYFRGSWKKTARLAIGFAAKDAKGGKAQIALQVSKLASKAEVERERAAWKSALRKLKRGLEG